MMISGWSALDFAPNPSVELLSPKARLQEDYFFSKYNHIWGWASWARAWRKYELESSDFTKDFAHFDFSSAFERRSWRKHCAETLRDGKGGARTISQFFDEIDRLQEEHLDDEAACQKLELLYEWGERLGDSFSS